MRALDLVFRAQTRSRRRPIGFFLLSFWIFGQLAILGHGFAHARLQHPAKALAASSLGSRLGERSFASVSVRSLLFGVEGFTLSYAADGGHHAGSSGCQFCQLLSHAPLALAPRIEMGWLLLESRACVVWMEKKCSGVSVPIILRGRAPPCLPSPLVLG